MSALNRKGFDTDLRCTDCNRKSGTGGMWPVVVMQSGDRCWDCDRLARHADEELIASLRRARDLDPREGGE